MPPRQVLSRDPKLVALIREVRNDHRGYQRFGHTVIDAGRALQRDSHLYRLDEALSDLASAWLSYLHPAYPATHVFHASRNGLRHDYPTDSNLRRDLRNVRFNPGGPPNESALVRSCHDAARQFRSRIETSKGSGGRKWKKRDRAKAWADFDAVLSAVLLAATAIDNPQEPRARAVASGAIR